MVIGRMVEAVTSFSEIRCRGQGPPLASIPAIKPHPLIHSLQPPGGGNAAGADQRWARSWGRIWRGLQQRGGAGVPERGRRGRGGGRRLGRRGRTAVSAAAEGEARSPCMYYVMLCHPRHLLPCTRASRHWNRCPSDPFWLPTPTPVPSAPSASCLLLTAPSLRMVMLCTFHRCLRALQKDRDSSAAWAMP